MQNNSIGYSNQYGIDRFIKFGKSKGLKYNPTVPIEHINKRPIYNSSGSIVNLSNWGVNSARPKARARYDYSLFMPDPYETNVVLHLKGDGANNSTNIVDSSPTPKTVTRFGDAVISTAQSKYGGSSIFQGTNGYLSVPMTYTPDFTIESWLYGNNGTLCGTWSSGNLVVILESTGVSIHIGTWLPGFNITLPSSQWYHLAITRTNNIIRVFVNGIQATTTVTNSTALTGGTLIIFNRPSLYTYFKEYIDSFRITNGIARYISNFNPETDTYLAY